LRKLPIAPEGWPLILIPAVAAVAAAVVGWWIVAAVLALLAVAVAAFFRDPERRVPRDSRLVLAPADGKVTRVERGEDGSLRVSIFLSVLDVHLNRAPVAGRVEAVRYRPGRLLPANLARSADDNEQNELRIDSTYGPVRVVQIAGIIARRIVCRVQPGDELALGDRFGMIRFGSRTDLLLPPGAQAAVEPGARCRAGQTVVARWQESTS
jgi:phosphatidylserine decarboxylase